MGWCGAEEKEGSKKSFKTAWVTVNLLGPLTETRSRAEELAFVGRSGVPYWSGWREGVYGMCTLGLNIT